MPKQSSAPFLFVVLAILCGYFGYIVYTASLPCVKPIAFTLTAYDARFGLPQEDVNQYVKDAAAVWNKQLGKEVFKPVATAPELPVIFVYNSTQRTVETVSMLQNKIDAQKDELRDVANEYGTLKKQYDSLNSQGKATQEMYDKLTALHAQYEALRAKINSAVAQGNTISGEEFEEGKYIRDKDGTRIYIYAFQDKTELMRTLIHEFGHALGLEHTENPDSIMYRSNNTSQNISLTREDLAELKKVCDAEQKSTLAVLYTYATKAMHAFRFN